MIRANWENVNMTKSPVKNITMKINNVNTFKRPAIANTLQRQVLIEAGFKCTICNSLTCLEIHHIIPYRDINAHHYQNLIAICTECHKKLQGRETNVSEKLLKIKKNIEKQNFLSIKNNLDLIKSYEILSDQGVYDRRIISNLNRILMPLTRNDPTLKARMILSKAQLAKHRGQVRVALDCALCALYQFKQLQDIKNIVKTLHLIGGIYFIKEDFLQALVFYNEAENIVESIPFLNEKRAGFQADIWRDIGITYLTLGEYSKALDFNEKSIFASEASANIESYAIALMDRGKVLTTQRKTDIAYEYLTNSEKQLPTNSVLSRIMILNFYANLFRRDGDFDKAESMISLSKRYARIFGLGYEIKTVQRNEEGIKHGK